MLALIVVLSLLIMTDNQRLHKAINGSIEALGVCSGPQLLQCHVKGETGNAYMVRISNETAECSCPDHCYRNEFCKHILFVSSTILPMYPHIKQPCAYGIHCYRTNWQHLMNNSHPKRKQS